MSATYGDPKTFELNMGQINVLFELLEREFKNPDKDERIETLRAFRNQLYRYLD